VHLADIADDDAYRLGLRGRVAMVDVGGARTAIWVAHPVKGSDRLVLNLVSRSFRFSSFVLVETVLFRSISHRVTY